MQTLSERRKEIYQDPDLKFCSSLALYALAESKPHPDIPDYAELACVNVGGAEGILLCLSPVDAVIQQWNLNSGGRKYAIFPCEAFDPRIFIQSHDGWLSLYIVYGLAAHGNKLLLDAHHLPRALLYPVHMKFDPENVPEHFHIEFNDKMTGWLDKLHKKAGMSDHRSLAYEQAQSSMAEIEMTARTALETVDFHLDELDQEVTQCAIFDPVESQWRFVDFADMDSDECREFHGNIS